MAHLMDNNIQESIFLLVRRALDCWTSRNNVRTSKASSLILVNHALKDYMYHLDMDRHCILQDKTLQHIHLDNNAQQDTDDSLE